MTTAYPKLRDENFEVVKDVLGLEVIFSPDVEDERVKREYEIYSYHDGSIGRELVELFKYVWKEFTDKPYSIKREYLSLIFPPNIPNFALDFCKASVNALKSIGYKFPDIEYGDRKFSSYKVDGLTLRYVGELNLPMERINLSLIDVLDCLAPAVMLLNGLQFDLEIDKMYNHNIFYIKREYDRNPLHDLNCGFYELIRR